MTIRDYLKKHATTAREDGVPTALSNAAAEAGWRGLAPLATWRGTPIWAGDWDICLVLDACRHDLWCEVEGWAPSRYSVGSASPEWMTNTFARRYDEKVSSTAYVTANPFSAKDGDETAALDADLFPLADRGFAHLDEVWRDRWGDGELPTVDPATLTDRAMWAWDHADADQLVVHYMQPHVPFRARPEWCDGWDLDGFGTGGGRGKDDWHRVRDGEIGREEMWAAYADNLEWVLEEVARWTETTEATILVTSDHGNAMGEWGQWGHPPHSGNPVLRRVPWVTLEGRAMRQRAYDAAPPEQTAVADGVDERLSALGYQ